MDVYCLLGESKKTLDDIDCLLVNHESDDNQQSHGSYQASIQSQRAQLFNQNANPECYGLFNSYLRGQQNPIQCNQFHQALEKLCECINIVKEMLTRHPEMASIKKFYNIIRALQTKVMNYLRGSYVTQKSMVNLIRDSQRFYQKVLEKKMREEEQAKKYLAQRSKLSDRSRGSIEKPDPLYGNRYSDDYLQQEKQQWIQKFQQVITEAQTLLLQAPDQIKLPSLHDFLSLLHQKIIKDNASGQRAKDVGQRPFQGVNSGGWSTTMLHLYSMMRKNYDECYAFADFKKMFNQDLEEGKKGLEEVKKDKAYKRVSNS